MALRKGLVWSGGYTRQLQAGDIWDHLATSKINDNAGAAVICSVVYPKTTSGHFDLARADAAGTASVFGLVFDTSIASAGTGIVQVAGRFEATTGQWDVVTGQSGGLTSGSVYYLDPATAGKLTTTKPTTPGQFVVQVGIALSTTELAILLQPPIAL